MSYRQIPDDDFVRSPLDDQNRGGIGVSGKTGELRKGYQVVARLGPWSLEPASDVIHATPLEVNRFWITGSDRFELRLKIGRRRLWVWREVEVVSLGQPLALRVIGSPVTR